MILVRDLWNKWSIYTLTYHLVFFRYDRENVWIYFENSNHTDVPIIIMRSNFTMAKVIQPMFYVFILLSFLCSQLHLHHYSVAHVYVSYFVPPHRCHYPFSLILRTNFVLYAFLSRLSRRRLLFIYSDVFLIINVQLRIQFPYIVIIILVQCSIVVLRIHFISNDIKCGIAKIQHSSECWFEN